MDDLARRKKQPIDTNHLVYATTTEDCAAYPTLIIEQSGNPQPHSTPNSSFNPSTSGGPTPVPRPP